MRYLSLFSGVEAASLAWGPLGWEPAAFCEVDDFACAVLAARFPEVPNLGDVTEVDWSGFDGEHGPVDVVVGGSPCQSFSVAGDRTGLSGASGLMWEYVRAVSEVVPDRIVWENVPGALSSSGGEDFGCLLRALDELGYGLAWRVLDAQFYGVAQRRRRVFLVGRLGDADAREACEVLFEPASLRWDIEAGRDKRKALAAAAEGGAGGAGGVVGFVGEHGGNTGLGLTEGVSPPVTAKHAPSACLTPWDVQSKRVYAPEGTAPTLQSGGGEGVNIQPVVLTQYGREVAGTLAARHDSSPCADRGANVVAYGMSDTTLTPKAAEELQPTLDAHGSGGSTQAVAHAAGPQGWVVRRLTPVECERLMGFPDGWTDLSAADAGSVLAAMPQGSDPKVARRVARWCEKTPDGPRYKACGNSMAVPVMRWIGERMETASGGSPWSS